MSFSCSTLVEQVQNWILSLFNACWTSSNPIILPNYLASNYIPNELLHGLPNYDFLAVSKESSYNYIIHIYCSYLWAQGWRKIHIMTLYGWGYNYVTGFEKRAHFTQNAKFLHFSNCHHTKTTEATDFGLLSMIHQI